MAIEFIIGVPVVLVPALIAMGIGYFFPVLLRGYSTKMRLGIAWKAYVLVFAAMLVFMFVYALPSSSLANASLSDGPFAFAAFGLSVILSRISIRKPEFGPVRGAL